MFQKLKMWKSVWETFIWCWDYLTNAIPYFWQSSFTRLKNSHPDIPNKLGFSNLPTFQVIYTQFPTFWVYYSKVVWISLLLDNIMFLSLGLICDVSLSNNILPNGLLISARLLPPSVFNYFVSVHRATYIWLSYIIHIWLTSCNLMKHNYVFSDNPI